MDAPPRIGIRAVVEWVVAAALLAAVIGVGSNAVRQVRAVTARTCRTAEVPTPTMAVRRAAATAHSTTARIPVRDASIAHPRV